MKETIYYLVVYTVEALILWQYFINIFSERTNRHHRLLYILSGYVGLFLISQCGVFLVNSIAFFLANTILGYTLYETTKRKACFHALITTVAMNVTELLIFAIIGNIFSDFTYYQKDFPIFILMAVLCKLLYFLCLQIVIRVFGKNKENSSDGGNGIILLCVVPIVTMWVTLTMLFVGVQGFLPKQLDWMVIASATLMLVLNIVIFGIYTYMQRVNRDFLSMHLQWQKESADAHYYRLLSEQNENQKILIHDVKKHLYTIDSFLDENNIKVKEYISNIIDSSDMQQEIHICDNTLLNIILLRYKELCQKRNIRFNMDIRKNCVDFLTFEDITALFGNLLDNAVEAASAMEGAYVDLSVMRLEHDNMIIKLINSCSKAPSRDSEGNLVTNKKNRVEHGIGMKSVEKVVKRYRGNLKNYYVCENRTFHTVIILNE